MAASRSRSKIFRLGVPQSGYNLDRNILGSVPSWMERVRPLDPFRCASSVAFRAYGRMPHPVGFRFCEPYLPRVDLLHFFNTLASTETPWVTTFEHCLPRWERRDESISSAACRAGMDLILGNSCRGLLAFSDASRNIAVLDWARRFGAAEAHRAAAKIDVLLPPQPVVAGRRERPRNPRTLFAFVGGDLYRKGGLETLKALWRLHDRGQREWDAVVVGRLDSFGDYASGSDASSRAEALELLGRLAPNVRHHERLDARGVKDLLSRADYYLFPTLADTFGYSALEAMACGAVVISTNVRAMAEVVDESVGHSIRLPLDENREIHRRPDFLALKDQLVDELESVILDAIDAPEVDRARKSDAAVARLRDRHDPARHAAKMESIYCRALGLPPQAAVSASSDV
jgi:glycosyltransferase involved in cell wall biosynthesis